MNSQSRYVSAASGKSFGGSSSVDTALAESYSSSHMQQSGYAPDVYSTSAPTQQGYGSRFAVYRESSNINNAPAPAPYTVNSSQLSAQPVQPLSQPNSSAQPRLIASGTILHQPGTQVHNSFVSYESSSHQSGRMISYQVHSNQSSHPVAPSSNHGYLSEYSPSHNSSNFPALSRMPAPRIIADTEYPPPPLPPPLPPPPPPLLPEDAFGRPSAASLTSSTSSAGGSDIPPAPGSAPLIVMERLMDASTC